MSHIIAYLFAIVFIGGIYLVPSINAASRKHRNTGAIFALNLLLGWTFLGWVGALIWSFTNPSQPSTVVYVNADGSTPRNSQ